MSVHGLSDRGIFNLGSLSSLAFISVFVLWYPTIYGGFRAHTFQLLESSGQLYHDS